MTYSFHVPYEKNSIDFFQKNPLKLMKTILENSGFQLASRWKHCCVDDQSSGVTSMAWWAYVGSSIMGSQWPTRDSAQSHHLNSNALLLRRVDGSKQVRKLSPLLSCLFD